MIDMNKEKRGQVEKTLRMGFELADELILAENLEALRRLREGKFMEFQKFIDETWGEINEDTEEKTSDIGMEWIHAYEYKEFYFRAPEEDKLSTMMHFYDEVRAFLGNLLSERWADGK